MDDIITYVGLDFIKRRLRWHLPMVVGAATCVHSAKS